jgi:PAS domain S-box-containing protein
MGIIRDVLAEARAEAKDTPEDDSQGEGKFLKDYSEALFRKLEKKMADLEQANLALTRTIIERKQTEEALRESEKKYRTLVTQSPDGIFIVDLQGTFLAVNKAMCERLKYSEEEFLSMKIWDIVPEKYVDLHKKRLADILRGEAPNEAAEYVVRGKDEKMYYIEVLSNPYFRENEVIGFQGIARDITDRKRAEEALRQSEEKYRSVVENANEAIFVAQDGMLKFINPKTIGLIGYPKEELVSKPFVGFIYPEDREMVLDRHLRRMRGEALPEMYSFRIIDKDGNTKWVEINAVKISWENRPATLNFLTDITERKLAEMNVLRQSAIAEAINGLLRETMSCETDEEVAHTSLSIAEGLTSSNFGWIGKVNPSGRLDTIAISDPGWDSCRMDKSQSIRMIKDMEICGIWGRVLKDGKSLITNNPAIHPDRVGLPSGHPELTSFLGVPLKQANQIIGMIALGNKPLGYELHDQEAIETLSVALVEALGRKRAEGALRESEKRFRELYNNAPVGYHEFDIEGRITSLNRTELEMLGYTLEERIGQFVWSSITEEEKSRQTVLDKLAGVVPPSRSLERTYRRKDGTTFPVLIQDQLLKDSEGKIKGMRSTVQDITERKRAEEDLRKSEERYRSLFNGLPIALYRTTPEGQIVDSNPALVEMLGYPNRESLLAVNAHDTYANLEDRIKWQSSMDIEGIVRNYEKQLRRLDAKIIWVEENTRAVRDAEDRVVYYEGSFQDVTGRKKKEQEMMVLQEQLRQSQKMEAIGRLAGGIAHDFNNLLTIIKGYTQLSLLEMREGDPLRANLQEVKNATDRASDLIRQILAFSRRQVLDMMILDLDMVMGDLDKMLRRVIGEDIELVTLLAEDLGRVKTDPGQIQQVIMNLAVNAKDAMPNGGKLTIETENVELDEAYARAHVAVTPGRYVMLSVSDTGVGMSAGVRDQVFEPFFTTKEKGKGTGLGLSTVYGIVKQSGGNIWVYSESGRGTTFKIYLPRVDEPLEEVKGVAVRVELPRGSETILVVEDEEKVRKLTVRILRGQGYTVLEAPHGDDALLVCEQHEGPIHLLVTDVVMPGMSGGQLADRVERLRPEMKILYVSGYTDNAIVHHGVLEKGVNYIQKPFTIEGLARKVREVLDK